MTSFEFWSLIISGFSALGTVSAVAIALWATLSNRKRFVVKDVAVRSNHEIIGSGDTQSVVLKEANVCFLIENKQDFQLEVFSILLHFAPKSTNSAKGISGTGFGDSLRGTFITAQSQYEVWLNIGGAGVSLSEDEIGDIVCEIKTSAGDTTVPFPSRWRKALFDCISLGEV